MRGPEKLADFGKQVLAAKIENADVKDLRDLLIEHIDASIHCMEAIVRNDPSNYENLETKSLQTRFYYRNKYYNIMKGHSMPVVNSSAGELYAYKYGDVSFGLASVEESNRLGGEMVSMKAKGKFILLKVAIFNDTKSAITLRMDGFKLFDKQDREYLPVLSKLETVNVKQLNPNMGMEMSITFDMPPLVSANEYKLRIAGDFSKHKPEMPLRVDRTGF